VFEADLRTGEIRKAGRRLALQEQPFRVLAALLERSGEMVTRDELRQRVWPEGTFVDFDIGLNKAVTKIRDALGDSATAPRFVETFPRRGYRFIAAVDPVFETDKCVDGTAQGTSSVYAEPPVVAHSERRRYGPKRFVLLALLAPLALAAAALWGRWSGADGRPAFGSLAVLPLENLSGDPDQEYLADGITDEVITELAKIGSLRVISRTSVMRFKGGQKSIPEIARELNVAAVVEGSLVRAGNRVRVRAQLIDAASDQHIWAQSYEHELADILTLQRQLAHDIAVEINAELAPSPRRSGENAAARPIRIDAHENYVKGQLRLHDGPAQALRYFERAIELDPNYAAAYAGLAETLFWPAWTAGTVSPGSAFPAGKAAALKALALDPASSAAHAALAWEKLFYEWNWRAAEDQIREAIRLSPNNAWAHHHYARILAVNARVPESIHEAERMLELDPLDFRSGGNMAWMLYLARRHDDSIRELQRMIAMYPSIEGFHRFQAWNLTARGRFAEAIEELELVRRPDDAVIADLGFARGGSGDRAGARKALKELQVAATRRYVSPYYFAIVYTGLRERDLAFSWLDKAFEERSPFLVYLRTEPKLDYLRSDVRFDTLLRRVGFDATPR
jgi:TolB-like protein/DNA-binding winged helix-turn-helix (wHTH) protein/Flp pilus assembly protein TadD